MFHKMKLGKAKPRFDKRTLPMAKYLKLSGLPPVLPEVSWCTKLTAAHALPMYQNDQIGDCVEAAAGHIIQQWSYYAGSYFEPAEQDIVFSYEAVGGYVPGMPSTDNGTSMLDYLNYWRTVGVAGKKIAAYVSVNFANLDEVRAAVYLFGNVYCGFALPLSAQSGNIWTVPNGGITSGAGQPGSWGGHCVPIFAMSPKSLTCATWGQLLKMSHNFFQDYCDECYALLSPEWFEANALSPSGFDLAQLQADLQLVAA